ncbi:RagB/SusD family nutrient uptake outer membrane protein [Ferruginibacter paludis]|uniref:RagB/SusD family nutrient uptake outer membrane protein n=1 Tax=Ferruginibacter TaxID=1004303 RepID=UPI0025B500C4|nr:MULTISPECIES: RagB/SusD family nutrient uptake outer membrane protein [Ferruginibacter]MDB5278742.1 RagB/SusD family nutrient uptake outer membrane protein [Ferruginibacter sp.]MDN3656870.1 RagB/SusD family nutrient uptake outer membrane protein [Ferruginibacter paludis]
MKKIILISTIAVLLFSAAGCKKDSAFLDVQPNTFLTNDQVFSDPALVLSVLGDLYNRQLDFSGLDNGWGSFTDFSESFPSENSSFARDLVQRTGWNYDNWGVNWFDSYNYIRDLNLFLQRDSASTALSDGDKKRFSAEARFLRANFYFELAKRYGGVPLSLQPLSYDYNGDATYLQIPRSKEAQLYDFIISEAEAIKGDLPADVNEKSRASKGAALAMEARAALYAGSIAKYGANTPSIATPGGEVGISAAKSNDYYAIVLRATSEIINGSAGAYKLYTAPTGANATALADNYANLFLDKTSPETIFFEDFKTGAKTHGFTTNDQPYSISDEGGDAGRLDPSLNLAEAFEKTDNTYAPFATKDGSGNPIYYSNIQDIFADRDARLAGTILLPGSLFKGRAVDIWAGYELADGSVITSDEAGHLKPLTTGGTPVQVVGKDGPVNGLEFRTQTGFYIRKYLDPTVGSGRRGQGSTVAFIRYRYAEVLLNAAEAAFETGDNITAALYLNQVRSRAGLTVPLTAGDINFNRIVHERRVELCFEGHILYDMKRWRIADKVWDGVPTTLSDLKSNIGVASRHSTQPWGLWPYKTYFPGSPDNNKWLFKETLPAVVTGANRFLFGNYYTFIGDDVRAANPQIVKQPNQ